MSHYFTQHGVHLSISRYAFALPLTTGKLVLELGCGLGNGSNFLANKGTAAVMGGDIVRELVEYAAANYRHDNLHFAVLDAQRLPFRTGSVDVVTAFELIEHLEKQDDFLRECHRVLKKGGLFLCSTPNREVFSASDRPWYPGHASEFSITEFREALIQYFKEVALYGLYPYYGKKERTLDKAISRRKSRLESSLISLLSRYGLLKVASWLIGLLAPQFRLLQTRDLDREFTKALALEYQPYPLREGAIPPLDLIALSKVG